jgi:hypothetical protein
MASCLLQSFADVFVIKIDQMLRLSKPMISESATRVALSKEFDDPPNICTETAKVKHFFLDKRFSAVLRSPRND